MSRQTRIDQFYKSVSTKHTSDMISVKVNATSKTKPNPKNCRDKMSKKQTVKQFQHIKESEAMLDCMIVYEKGSAVHNISVSIATVTKNDDEIDLRHLEHKECLSNYNERVSINNANVQLNKTPKNKLEDDSPTKHSSIDHQNTCLKDTPTKKLRTLNENNVWLTESNSSPSTPKRSNYVPKAPSRNSPKSIPRNRLFDDFIDNDIVEQAIMNMNMAKQGAIPLNNFNLEEIYSKNVFNYQSSRTNTSASLRYDLCDIREYKDLKSKTLFTTIFKVFSNPVNCGYFDESELDFIYSIITLPKDSKMLLARMIKRKRGWFRKSSIDYPEISSELKSAFDVLVSRSICTFDIKREPLYTILELLQVKEIRQICQDMKVNSKGNKESNLKELLKLIKNKPLFPGMKNPSTSLYASIFAVLDYCVCITPKTWDIIDRIITLLVPNEDPSNSMSDTFMKLSDVYSGKIMFPNASKCFFPVFSSKQHLVRYIEAKSTLSMTLQQIERKNWDKVEFYGNMAVDILPNLLKTESLSLKNSILPVHVRRYMPGYMWLKVLSACIEAYKKIKNKSKVVEILNLLIGQDCHMHAYKGRWYAELALIQMHHLKDANESARIIILALDRENLTQVDKVDLLKRANKIFKKKTGVKSCTRAALNKVLDDHNHQMPRYEAPSNIIDAKPMPMNTAGNKSVWCIEITQGNKSYGSVETLALYYYREQGFLQGLHCEGSLPIILFATLFWEELYGEHVPGAFATQYQEAPSDLFTEKFYENRKERIDMKVQMVEALNSETLGTLMEDKLKMCRQYQSIMSPNLQANIQIKEIVCCLGVQGVIGICKRLIQNFKLWRAGFPDLIVWNYNTKAHKIIEVKGPRDELSTKQRLWLEYLYRIGLHAEVCLVQDKFNTKKWVRAVEESDDCD